MTGDVSHEILKYIYLDMQQWVDRKVCHRIRNETRVERKPIEETFCEFAEGRCVI